MATPKNANDFFSKINYKGHSIKNALIVGGGVLTHYLCEILEKSCVSLKIIEKDIKACEELCSQWHKVDVIHGDPSDRELLKEEGIAQAGAFVALADHDEENILLSVFAKSEGCQKLVTKVNRIDYDSVINQLDLDASVCPRAITSDVILRFVRSMQNAVGSNMETLYNIIQDKVEASEFIVKENSPVTGVPLYQLKLKSDLLVAAITRGNEVIVPRGQDMILPGDTVIIVSKHSLRDVADVLK